jgi:hypothetical protein
MPGRLGKFCFVMNSHAVSRACNSEHKHIRPPVLTETTDLLQL